MLTHDLTFPPCARCADSRTLRLTVLAALLVGSLYQLHHDIGTLMRVKPLRAQSAALRAMVERGPDFFSVGQSHDDGLGSDRLLGLRDTGAD
jgi:hypothetical protein